MKSSDPGNFLLSLAVAIAAETGRREPGQGLVFMADPAQAAKASIWAHAADEGRSTPVYSVLRSYGGPSAGGFVGNRMQALSVQCDTRGMDAAAVLAQAYQVHEALLNDDQTPASCWTIAAKVIDGAGTLAEDPEAATAGNWLVRLVTLNGVPGTVGRDEAGRWMAVFNFDVRYERAPA